MGVKAYSQRNNRSFKELQHKLIIEDQQYKLKIEFQDQFATFLQSWCNRATINEYSKTDKKIDEKFLNLKKIMLLNKSNKFQSRKALIVNSRFLHLKQGLRGGGAANTKETPLILKNEENLDRFSKRTTYYKGIQTKQIDDQFGVGVGTTLFPDVSESKYLDNSVSLNALYKFPIINPIKSIQNTNSIDIQQPEDQQEHQSSNPTTISNKKSQFSYQKELDGNGSSVYEQVVFYQDQQTGQTIAKKCFKSEKEYSDEQIIYEQLQSGKTEQDLQLRELVALPVSYDAEEKTIYFSPGLTSISDLMSEQAFVFTADQALCVFSQMLQFVLLMKQNGTDLFSLQPHNIILVPLQQAVEKYIPKIIDIGKITKQAKEAFGADLSSQSISSSSAIQYNQSNNQGSLDQIISSIFRNFIQMLTAKRSERQFEGEELEIQQIIKNIENIYEKTNSTGLNIVLDFIKENKGIEQFNLEKLSQVCRVTQKEFFQINDTQKQVLDKILMKQKINQVKVECYLSPTFGLKMNFELEGSLEANYSNPFELSPTLDYYLRTQEYENIIIVGEVGSGKSLCLLKLMKNLSQEKAFIPVYINLGDFAANKQSNSEQLETIIRTAKSQIGLSLAKIVFFLDAFHELHNKSIGIYEELTRVFKEQVHKIFVTTRSQYATNQDLLTCFANHKLIYICPLSVQRRKNFIEKMSAQFKEYQHAMNGLTLFNNLDQYDQIFSEILALDQMTKNPLLLMLTLVVLPELKRQKQINNIDISQQLRTRYELFDNFLKLNLRNKLNSLTLVNESSYNLSKIYYAANNKNLDNINNDTIIKDIEQDFFNINQLLSWNMIQTKNQKIQYKIVNKMVKSVENSENKRIENVEDILRSLSPIPNTCQSTLLPFNYIHKTFYEFFVAQSLIQETLQARGSAIDENQTKMKFAFLANDLDILRMVGEYITQLPIQLQYSLYFETWYKSVLLSRKIFNGNKSADDDNNNNNNTTTGATNRVESKAEALQKECLKRIASNCLNLMASSPQCDMTERDFSNCYLCYAHLCRRDISRSKFNRSVLLECDLTQTKFEECSFFQADLRGFKYHLYSATKNKLQGTHILAISAEGNQLASVESDRIIKIWDLDSNNVTKCLAMQPTDVTALAFSRSEKKIISASEDNIIKLWDLNNLEEIAKLEFKPGKISIIALSANEKFIAAVSHEQTTIIVWQIGFQENIMFLTGQYRAFTHIEFSPSEFVLVSGSSDGTINIWDLFTKNILATIPDLNKQEQKIAIQTKGKFLAFADSQNSIVFYNFKKNKATAKLIGHNNTVVSLSFATNSKVLISGDSESYIRVWDLKTKNILHFFKSALTKLQFIALQPNDKIIATSSESEQIQICNLDYTRLITAVKGHRDSVTCVTYSPDQKTLASSSRDSTIIIWDLSTMKEQATLAGHSRQIYQIAYSQDGKRLVSASFDKTIKLWDTNKMKHIQTFNGHTKIVYSVVFALDNQTFISSSQDKTIKIWNSQSAEAVATLEGHSSLVYSLAVSKDGQFLASASFDKTVKLWGLSTKKVVHTFSEPDASEMLSVAFSPTDDILASSSYDGSITFWNTKQFKKLLKITLTDQKQQIYSINYSKDGKYLAAGGQDKILYLWDTVKQIVHKTCIDNDSTIFSVDFSFNSETVAFADKSQTVKFWNFNQQKSKEIIQAHSQKLQSVIFTADSNILISGSSDQSVKLWNLKDKKEIAVLEGHTQIVYSVAITKDGKLIASGSSDGTIRLWNLQSKACVTTLLGHKDQVYGVDFSSDGQFLASCGKDLTVRIWNVQQQKEYKTLTGHKDVVNAVSYSSDNLLLASASDDAKIILWSVTDYVQKPALEGHISGVLAIAFSENSSKLVSVSWDKIIMVWDTKQQKAIAKTFNQQEILAISVTTDGKTLATSSQEGTVQLWDLENLKEFANFKHNSESVNSIQFSKDNSMLAQGNSDGTIILQNLNVSKLLENRGGQFPIVMQSAISEDGKMLASVRENQQIMLWDLQTNKLLGTIAQKFTKNYSLQFFSNDKILAYGASDSKIFLWNTQTLKEEINDKLQTTLKPLLQKSLPSLFPYYTRVLNYAGVYQNHSFSNANFQECIFNDSSEFDQAKNTFQNCLFSDSSY